MKHIHVAGSADGSEWVLLRRHVDDKSLSFTSVSHTWPLDLRLLHGPVRFVGFVRGIPNILCCVHVYISICIYTYTHVYTGPYG